MESRFIFCIVAVHHVENGPPNLNHCHYATTLEFGTMVPEKKNDQIKNRKVYWKDHVVYFQVIKHLHVENELNIVEKK